MQDGLRESPSTLHWGKPTRRSKQRAPGPADEREHQSPVPTWRRVTNRDSSQCPEPRAEHLPRCSPAPATLALLCGVRVSHPPGKRLFSRVQPHSSLPTPSHLKQEKAAPNVRRPTGRQQSELLSCPAHGSQLPVPSEKHPLPGTGSVSEAASARS